MDASISIFEQWWLAIEPAVQANTLNFWQFIYKEIYMNLIKGDRWLQYLKGLGVTLEVSFYSILVGLALGTIGMDDVFGVSRFDFGNMYLSRGLEFGVVAMAVFGVNELLGAMLEPQEDAGPMQKVTLKDLYPNREEWKRSVGPILRASVLGFVIGLMPGPAGTLASFSSYAMEKKLSKHPDEFGKGAVEGVAGPEAANNAASSAAFVPLLSLGLPFAPPAALLLTAQSMLPHVPKACAVCLLMLCVAGGMLAANAVCTHESAWLAQIQRIEEAKAEGREQVAIASVPSVSRYTMSVMLDENPQVWPNSTLSKYFGIRISGE